MQMRTTFLPAMILLGLLGDPALGHAEQESDNQAAQPRGRELFREHLADYDCELRRADGGVDVDAMVTRLNELGVTTYYWLIWHAATDWDDLKLFLPKAAQAGIEVWVYLVPPSESPPSYPMFVSFRAFLTAFEASCRRGAFIFGGNGDDKFLWRSAFFPLTSALCGCMLFTSMIGWHGQRALGREGLAEEDGKCFLG